MFSVVRGYNILVIVLAQYLASVFIFGKQLKLSQIIFDPALLMLVLASTLCKKTNKNLQNIQN
jgi:4-hydroxybenzoate polyprenyltransferase